MDIRARDLGQPLHKQDRQSRHKSVINRQWRALQFELRRRLAVITSGGGLTFCRLISWRTLWRVRRLPRFCRLSVSHRAF